MTTIHRSSRPALALFVGVAVAVSMAVVQASPANAVGSTYYVSASGCSNAYQGTEPAHTTGVTGPWCDFANVNALTLGPGDSVLLSRGSTWNVNGAPNNRLVLSGAGSSWSSPITLGAYGIGAVPIIRGSGTDPTDSIGTLANPSYWSISGLEFSNAGNGLVVNFSTRGNTGLRFDNMSVHDLGGCFLSSPAGCPWMSTGLSITTTLTTTAAQAPVLTDIEIQNNIFTNVNEAASIWASDPSTANTYSNTVVKDNTIQNVAGNAFDFKAMTGLRVADNYLSNLSTTRQPQGTTSTFMFRVSNATFANNYWNGVANTGTSDMSAIDAEGYIDSVKYLGNTFANTAGPAVEFLQLDSGSHPDRGPDDYNTNNTVDSNTFINNSTPLLTINNVRNPTGTVVNNLATGSPILSERMAGGIAAFSVSANLTAVSAPNSAPAGFSSTANSGGASCTAASNCWSYEQYNGSAYVPLSWDAASSRWGSSAPSVGRFSQLPAAGSSTWVSRSWTASAAGTLAIRGRVLKNDVAGGDGVLARITKNGTVIWPTAGGSQSIAFNDASGVNSNLDGVGVAPGDVIRFEVSSGSAGNATNDATSWAPTVVLTPGSTTNLLSNGGFESGTTGWAAQSAAISSSTSSHSGTGAVKIASRSAVWGAATQDVKSDLLANGQGTYWASTWAKLALGTDSVAILVKTVDGAGSHWFTTPYASVGTAYTQVFGGIGITWTGTLSSAIIYTQGTSSTADLYEDDYEFRPATNLVSNGGFESGTTGWAAQSAAISSSTSSHSGTGAVKIASRSAIWGAATQDVKGDLLAHGQGAYWASTWAQLASGTDTVVILVKTVDGGGSHWFSTAPVSVGTAYAQVSGALNITWTGTLSTAIVYTQSTSSTADLYEDDFEFVGG